jgi:3-dehydroquinate synthetase
MIIKKKINKEDHNIEFVNTKKFEYYLSKKINDKDILIIDKNLIKNIIINKIYKDFSKRCFLVNGNERIKSLKTFSTLIEKILRIGIQRDSKLISIGGGTIGDLSGYIASSLLRGIDHIMVPTSLLAMVDSSIGGKTGINSYYGKNLIGSFYLPKKVLIYPDFLKSLPKRELNCGFAEIIKYSLINPGIFKNKLFNFKDIYQSNILEIIKISISTKLKYVSDFREKSDLRKSRVILNFGHTIGHAIENSNSYDQSIKHGEAITIGMLIELKISQYLKYYNASIEDEIKLIKKFNLPSNYKDFLTTRKIEILIKKMMFDKKTFGNDVNFILIDKNGGFVKKISLKKLKGLLNKIN